MPGVARGHGPCMIDNMDAEVTNTPAQEIRPARVYVLYIALTLLFVWTIASIQFVFVFKQVAWQQYIIPTLGGSLVGTVLARLKLLGLRMAAQRALFKGVADAASECSWLHDANGHLAYVSTAAQEVLGVRSDVLENQPQRLQQLLGGGDARDYQQRLQPLLRQPGRQAYEVNIHTHAGVEKTLFCQLESLLDKQGKIRGVLGHARDVSRESSREMLDLRKQFRRDEATGLGNRRLLLEDLRRLMANRHRKHVLLALHLAGLRHVRAMHGRETADRMMRALADRIQQQQGGLSTLYRLGNQELALVLEDCTEEQLAPWLKNLRSTTEAPIDLDTIQLSLGMRLGLAQFPEDAPEAETWLENAELAMRAARESSEHWAWFRPVLRQLRDERKALEQELIQAVHRGDVQAWAQPIYRVESLQITGFELHARWQSRQKGWTALEPHVDMLEYLGLTRRAQEVLIDQVLPALKRLRQRGIPLKCGMNLYTGNLLDRQFLPTLKQLVDTHGLPANCLVLELEEALLSRLNDYKRQQLLALDQAGFVLAVDHFGLGLASLRVLRELPVSIVKIDHALMADDIDAERQVFAAVVELGKSQQLDMLMDGLRTEAHLQQAREIGVDYIQGDFLHPAMPLRDLEKWLNEQGRQRPPII